MIASNLLKKCTASYCKLIFEL